MTSDLSLSLEPEISRGYRFTLSTRISGGLENRGRPRTYEIRIGSSKSLNKGRGEPKSSGYVFYVDVNTDFSFPECLKFFRELGVSDECRALIQDDSSQEINEIDPDFQVPSTLDLSTKEYFLGYPLERLSDQRIKQIQSSKRLFFSVFLPVVSSGEEIHLRYGYPKNPADPKIISYQANKLDLEFLMRFLRTTYPHEISPLEMELLKTFAERGFEAVTR